MVWLLILPLLMQAAAMVLDEFYFHYKRGLPRWERIGHPLDTLTVLACYGFMLAVPFSLGAFKIYLVLAVFSTLFVTKDEFIHARLCCAGEHWLHALLFILHPAVLAAMAMIWSAVSARDQSLLPQWLAQLSRLRMVFIAQFAVMLIFFFYQIGYWNFLWKENQSR